MWEAKENRCLQLGLEGVIILTFFRHLSLVIKTILLQENPYHSKKKTIPHDAV